MITMQEHFDSCLASDGLSVQLSGAFSQGAIQFPDTVDKLLNDCKQAMQNYYAAHGKYRLILDFQNTDKIASIGFSILEADVRELVSQQAGADLKFINFPSDFKASLEIRRTLYSSLSSGDGVGFRD
ncbi:MAG: hypothetical protein GY862_09930 [Gammaproteobacteria bacterium]|nr:hypothetical protein [Gammaproteobacteria bacterium]